MIPKLSDISSLVKENYKDIMLVGGSIATLSIAALLVSGGGFYFYVWKPVCEQIIATNNLIRERNAGNPALKEVKFEYADGIEIRTLLPHEVAKESQELPFCSLIASAKNVKQYEEKFKRHGVGIYNPYK